jgi:hypothetical protein
MSQQGNPFGGMVEPAMGPGGSALSPEEQALVELAQDPSIEDLDEGMVLRMMEDGSAEFGEPMLEVETEMYRHDANLAEVLSDSDLGSLSSDLLGTSWRNTSRT